MPDETSPRGPQGTSQGAAPGAPPGASPPARRPLDRSALERVIARAAELQAGVSDAPETLSEEEALALGQEVGLSPEHLRQALAEERTRVAVPEETGQLARLFGPAMASASRIVPGTPAEVLAAVDTWMTREECLQVKRRWSDRVTWEERKGIVGSLQRGLDVAGRGYALTRATEVGATVVAVDDKRVLVRLDADVSGSRARRVRAGAATAGIGVGAGAGAVAVGVVASDIMPVVAVAAAGMLVAGAAGGWQVAKQHREVVHRAQLALEQILDRLEHAEIRRPPATLADVIATAGRLLERKKP